jgi:hypothetical protein
MAEPARGKSSSEFQKEDKLTQMWPAAFRVKFAKVQADAQYSNAKLEKETANTADSALRSSSDVNGKEDLFRSDPQYEANYDAQMQADIYGAKRAVEPPRPPLELGRQQYTSGAYDESSTLLGEKNPLLPGLAVYGDWRTAIAYNNNNGKEIAQIATRLNLDVDFKITST